MTEDTDLIASFGRALEIHLGDQERSVFAGKLKITEQYLSQMIGKKKNLKIDTMRKYADRLGKTLDEFLSVLEPVETAEDTKNIHPLDPYTEEHQELVKGFISKAQALMVNKVLVEADRKNPMDFAEIATIIRKWSEGVKFIEVPPAASPPKAEQNQPERGVSGQGTGTDGQAGR